MITREDSMAFAREHVMNENLVNHMIAVGSIMKGLAEHFSEDPTLWEAVGILHDVDYETFGDDFCQHGAKSAEMVKDLLPEDGIKAILSHNELTGNKAETRFMKDKSFARQVSRENIMRCEEIGLSFSEFAQIAIQAMQNVASEIGLS
jgi:putative nucleotidyltransferase with HDIG domain